MKRLIHAEDKKTALECTFGFRYFDVDKHTYDPWVLKSLHEIYDTGYDYNENITHAKFVTYADTVVKSIFTDSFEKIRSHVVVFARMAAYLLYKSDSAKKREINAVELYSRMINTYITKNWNYSSDSDPSASFYNIASRLRCSPEFKVDTITVSPSGEWSNVESVVSFPIFSVLTRILDKVQRVQSMIAGNKLNHESAEDSLEDAVVYCAILMGLSYREEFVSKWCSQVTDELNCLDYAFVRYSDKLKKDMDRLLALPVNADEEELLE